MSNLIHERVAAARAGINPTVICRMPSGWAVLCDVQFLILGNLEPALHAHIIPRYLTEPEDLRTGPAFFYDEEFRNSIRFDRERDQELLEQIAAAIQARL